MTACPDPHALDDIVSSVRAACDLVRRLRDRDERCDQLVRASALLCQHRREFDDVLAHLDDAVEGVEMLELKGEP